MLNILDKLFQRTSPFRDTVLGDELLICSDWQQIQIKDSVKVEGDRQFVGIVLKLPFEIPYGTSGVKIPSGKIINPEIKLIDEDNNEFDFFHSGAGGTELSRYEYEGSLPSDIVYKKLLLRSEFPIKVERILWSTLSTKDLK